MKYIILDTETNGFLSKKGIVSQTCGRILQMAWSVYEWKNEIKKMKQQSYYITPYNYQVRATEIHGITDETLYRSSSFMEIFNLFLEDLKQVDAVVGHNIIFDESVLCNELNMYGQSELIKHFENVAWICSQKLSKQLYGGKISKLDFIYNKIFGMPINGIHNALNDINALGDIINYWIEHKMIKKSFRPSGSIGIDRFL